MSTLAADGLTFEQRLHFSEHGWLVLEEVLDAERCQVYIDALDRALLHHTNEPDRETSVHWLSNLHLYDYLFVEWLKIPGIIEANRQLTGVEKTRIDGLSGVVTDPHPKRHDDRDVLLDKSTWSWHRDFNDPDNMLKRDPDDPRLLCAADIVNATYLTPASAENGVTAFLDKSHLIAGEYDVVKEQCEPIQLEAPAGSIVIFAESLMHTATPVVSETPRYAMLYDFITYWFAHNSFYERPQKWVEHMRDEELRALFASPTRG